MVQQAESKTGGNHLQPPSPNGPGNGFSGERQVSGAGVTTSLEMVTPSGKYGINDLSLERLELPAEEVAAAQRAWNEFLEITQTREAAGEAIYNTLFEATPTMQELFTTPKAVQAMKFLTGIDALVRNLGDAATLRTLVETLGFQHLHLNIFPQRVVLFRDALLELFENELEDKFTQQARDGITAFMNYTGGGLIYVRTHYAKRLDILIESWSVVKEKSADEKKSSQIQFGQQLKHSDTDPSAISTDADSNSKHHNGEKGGDRNGEKNASHQSHNSGKSKSGESGSESNDSLDEKSAAQKQAQGVPTTFQEMFHINAAVMGINRRNTVWMNDVIDNWDAIVMNVKNSDRIKEESDVLALRLSKYPEGFVQLRDFKACMLAALRSLLPKIWTTAHEEAWTWLWENMARMLQTTMDSAPNYEVALEALFDSMDEEQMQEQRSMIYARFFRLCPAGQNYFKQSNTRLNFIAARIVAMTLELCKSPKKMVSEISALGLRHVGFGIPTELFAPFVTANVEVLGTLTTSEMAVEAFRWSLGLIAKILVRTILEGSTVVMKAINANAPKMLKKALTSAPRRDRASWVLDVQVGDQHISPLAWSIESGSLKVADAILRDLLTIRADRARYYYGADDLFERHPDIVKKLCEEAPGLLRTLLDGLIWRSHRTENGERRVHYFIKHMLVKPNGAFSESLKWISSSGDPSIVSHPIVATLAETLWSGVVLRQFISSRMWNMFSLVVFIMAQEVLPAYIEDPAERSLGSGVPMDNSPSLQTIRVLIFIARLFNYVGGMGRLACFHIYRIWIWCRNTMRRIIEEIDTDGNGTIDYEEMIEALHTFKDTVKAEIKKAVRVLRDDDGPSTAEDARRAIASKEKNMYNLISFALMLLLAVMCTQEPMLWCNPGDAGWPTDNCPAGREVRYRYSIFSMLSMVVHWFILVDLAVFSTEISAFLLVFNHVLGEVKQFFIAMGFLLLLFGSSISILCRNCPKGDEANDQGGNFSEMHQAIISLFAITVGLYQGDFRDIQEVSTMLLYAIFLFLTCSVVLLLNLLIAQLNQSYEYIYQDMLGFARLNRAQLIVDAMESVSRRRWQKFVEHLRFDERMEFDEGDLGLSGGVQTMEPATLHRQMRESILRFGGSTLPETPWPEDPRVNDVAKDRFSSAKNLEQHEDDGEDRLRRIESLVQKTLRRVEKGKFGDPEAVRGGRQSSRESGLSSGVAGGSSRGGSGTVTGNGASHNKFSSAVKQSDYSASEGSVASGASR